MKKYKTRPINFAGCHPVIAEALKRGESIECRVWDGLYGGQATGTVCGYCANNKYPYRCDESGVSAWMHAEPIPLKVKRIMPPERAIPVLIAEGWRFNSSGQMCVPGQTIQPAMFCRFGTPLDDPDTISWSWPPCIIEEVEDDDE